MSSQFRNNRELPFIKDAGKPGHCIFRKIYDNAILPTMGYKYDAGMDIYACTETKNIVINSGGFACIPTGIAYERNEKSKGYYLQSFIRSSLAKKGLFITGGVHDPTYTGEIKIFLGNLSDKNVEIKHGEKIAQFVELAYASPMKLYEKQEIEDSIIYREIAECSNIARGDKGFGSTN